MNSRKISRIGTTAKDTGSSILVNIINMDEDSGEVLISKLDVVYTVDPKTHILTFTASKEAVTDIVNIINKSSAEKQASFRFL